MACKRSWVRLPSAPLTSTPDKSGVYAFGAKTLVTKNLASKAKEGQSVTNPPLIGSVGLTGLGDPLMSQPAISRGKLFMAYPGGSPRGVHREQAGTPQPTAKVAREKGHRLLCADLRTGEHIWEQDIAADVISSPIIAEDQVLLTCFDGTSFWLSATAGTVSWQKQNAGTSAPLVADGQVVMTRRQDRGNDVLEGFKRLDVKRGEEKDKQLPAGGKADYFKAGREDSTGLSSATQKLQDSSVGSGGGAPAMAQLSKAARNVNVPTVAGAWALAWSWAQSAGVSIFLCARCHSASSRSSSRSPKGVCPTRMTSSL